MENKNIWYRQIPKMDVLLEKEYCRLAIETYGREPVIEVISNSLEEVRKVISRAFTQEQVEEAIFSIDEVLMSKLRMLKNRQLKRVINATGIVLHTNLGRAPLPKEAMKGLENFLSGYSNLEYNLEEGARGERYSHFEELVCKITGAEAAMAVNNNAGAALLMISAICGGGEVIVSRGEQVEIGGKFRIPDIIDQSGAKRVEIGTTNRTRLEDYVEAVTDNTKGFLKVHTSNYKITGFTHTVSLEELCKIGKEKNIPVIEDLGSGVLIDLSKYGLDKEPTVMDSIRAGVDLVSFSGDKLLGGPQAGIIVGKKEYIDRCKKHPLTRALRIDKFSAMILENIFHIYEDEAYAVAHIPVLSMLTATQESLKIKAEKVLEGLSKVSGAYKVQVVPCEGLAGGGSLPGDFFKSYGIAISGDNVHLNQLEDQLRKGEIPIISRIFNDSILIDVRTIFDWDLEELIEGLIKVLR